MRSTLKVQTPKAYSLGSVYQSSQAWNSLANCSCFHIHKKPFTRFSAMLLTDTGPESRKNNLVCKGLNAFPKCCRMFPVSYPTYPEIFMEIRSSTFPQTCKPLHLIWGLWNSLVSRDTVLPIIFCVVADITWVINENPFARFPVTLLKMKNQEIEKNSLVPKGDLKCNITQNVPDTPCVLKDLTWQFNENLFTRFL